MLNLKELGSEKIETIDNDSETSQWFNRLTVYFNTGDMIIEELHESNRGSISQEQLNGEAFSVTLPGLLIDDDLRRLAGMITEEMPETDREDWLMYKVRIFDWTPYFDCRCEDPYEVSVLSDLIEKYRDDPKMLEEAVSELEVLVVGFTEWMENEGIY